MVTPKKDYLGEILEDVGWGKYQYWMFFVCGCVMLT